MPAPFHKLKKTEILWLANNYCQKHRHAYIEHYQCYLDECPNQQPRVGFLDIEASNLSADFGIILSYCIKDGSSRRILEGVIQPEDLHGNPGDEDERVVKNCIADMGRFDRVVTFYGQRFDIPFIRTRAVACGLDFPNYGSLVHTDLYFVIRNRFKLSSNRLENACRVLLGKTDKTRIESRYWRAAARGDQKSLEYVLDHNRKDVLDLEKLYHEVNNYFTRRDTSI